MACNQCTARVLRSFVTDLTLQPTITTSRRALYPLKSSRASVRYTSSSAPRKQSAEVSSSATANSNNSGPDFLGLYTHAKQNPNKEALSSWGSSWKPETDFSSVKGHATRLNPELTSSASNPGAIEESGAAGFDFLDDFTSLNEQNTIQDLNSPEYDDDIDIVSSSLKRGFPTRASPSSANPELSEEEVSRAEYDIPWEDEETISRKMDTKHDPEENAWREWDTPKLWARKNMRERIMNRKTANGTRFPSGSASAKPESVLKITPYTDFRQDSFKAKMDAHDDRFSDKEKPAWLIEKEKVKGKLKGGRWNPFGRLSPAAVATMKQLKRENPGMTVEEYAPIFKMSPDAVRRILRSNWEPKPHEEEDRMTRWKKRGDNIWSDWVEKGLVETRTSRRARKEDEKLRKEEAAKKASGGIMFRQRLNLKNRIL